VFQRRLLGVDNHFLNTHSDSMARSRGGGGGNSRSSRSSREPASTRAMEKEREGDRDGGRRRE
jgi:hypothetical protein